MIDYEYQKYKLLGYIKEVKKKFQSLELYPYMDNLEDHRRDLVNYQNELKYIKQEFPSQLVHADLKNLNLVFESVVEGDLLIEELEKIVVFSIKEIDKLILEGKEIYSFVENQLEINPVGVMPLYDSEGYLILEKSPSVKKVEVYRYNLTYFGENSFKTGYKTMKTEYMGKKIKSFTMTYEKIKMDLVKSFNDLPNPSTFLIQSNMEFSKSNTILPVTKRILGRRLSLSF